LHTFYIATEYVLCCATSNNKILIPRVFILGFFSFGGIDVEKVLYVLHNINMDCYMLSPSLFASVHCFFDYSVCFIRVTNYSFRISWYFGTGWVYMLYDWYLSQYTLIVFSVNLIVLKLTWIINECNDIY